MSQALVIPDRYPAVPSVSRYSVRQCVRVTLVQLFGYLSAIWLSHARCACVVGIRVLRCDYSRVTRVSSTSYDSSNVPAVFCAFLALSRLCGVRQGYGCAGNGCCDDSSADSSASLAQCCSCGGFFPSFEIFALLWGLLIFLGILAFIPRLHFWCCLFCSACLFSLSSGG